MTTQDTEKSTPTRYGFIGLGDMGRPIATNICKAGTHLHVFDAAGTAERAPDGSTAVDSCQAVAENADVVFVCVPDGNASTAVMQAIIASDNPVTRVVIDLSTIGIAMSESIGKLASAANIDYIDSPVSGGRAGATAGTITVIWGGQASTLNAHRAVVESLSGNIFHVGDNPGQGQALKLLNNYLSATAMAATSEAILFGESHGLDMKTMLDVVNVSTGQSMASKDKFVNRVLTGTFDAGFRSVLMRKDMRLFMESIRAGDTPNTVASVVDSVWEEVDAANPGSDLTEVYRHLKSKQ